MSLSPTLLVYLVGLVTCLVLIQNAQMRWIWPMLAVGAWLTCGGIAWALGSASGDQAMLTALGCFMLLPAMLLLGLQQLFRVWCALLGAPVWLMLLAAGLT